jgi:hypothetical protein
MTFLFACAARLDIDVLVPGHMCVVHGDVEPSSWASGDKQSASLHPYPYYILDIGPLSFFGPRGRLRCMGLGPTLEEVSFHEKQWMSLSFVLH